MAYVNVAAYIGGRLAPTKKALREAVAGAPKSVALESTSPFTPFSGPLTEATEGVTYQAVGPDPWARRSWFASIKFTGGKWKVT